jgi:Tol biopolymer transport system component
VDDIVSELRRTQKKTSRVMRSSAQVPHQSAGTPVSSGQIPASPVPSLSALRKPPLLIGGTVGVIAAIALAVWLLSGPSLPQVNPNMEVSVVQIPATEYYYPGISPDGKWLAFPGSDLKGKWDIYMMLIETGESKRVTNDSTFNLGYASTARFSPDGTLITYARLDPKTSMASVCVVSVLSGQVRVVADTGVSPRWSPVDNRIFYFRGFGIGRSGYPGGTPWREYWSVSAKGGDERIEFIDSLGKGSTTFFSLGVSPDSRKLVFTRPTGGRNNEIFILDLESREERQLTHDQKRIDEAVWADNGYIFYTSNRSGNFNIWAIPEDGGEAVQITRGAGPDNGLTFSTAANRIALTQRTPVATAWIVNTDGTDHRQLFPEENIYESHISPDGKKLVLGISRPTLQRTLMLRDITGGGQDILFPADSGIARRGAYWSPSGKMIAYAEFRVGTVGESNAKVIDIAGGRRVRDLGSGMFVDRWVSDTIVLIARNISTDPKRPPLISRRILNLNTGDESAFFRDTVDAWPVMNNTAISYIGNGAIRLLSMGDYQENPKSEGRAIIRFDEISAWRSSDSWLYYRTKNQDALWRLNFRTLQRSKITELRPADNVVFNAIDYNDKLFTYFIFKTKTSIVKIDKVFKEH